MNLAETQALFWDALSGRRHDELGSCFSGTEALPAEARVRIYAEMVLYRQVDALREDFPQLAAQLGDHGFFHLVQDYVGAHPSESPDLGRLGRRLAQWLGDTGRRGLGELARLEWARAELFSAAPATPVTQDALAALGPDQFVYLRLRFVPALALLDFSYQIPAAWQALRDGAAAVELVPGQTSAAVWRKGFEVHHAELPADEAQALRLARSGAPLGEVCGAFAQREDPAAAAFETLASWFADEWISALLQ